MDNINEFKNHVMDGRKDKFLSDEALDFFMNNCRYSVIDDEPPTLNENEFDFISKVLADVAGDDGESVEYEYTTDQYEDYELIEKVKKELRIDGIQKYHFRNTKITDVPIIVKIYRHKKGFKTRVQM